MIRMLLIGYCGGIRSERRLCDEAHLNLAVLDDAAFGATIKIAPKFISPTDPAATSSASCALTGCDYEVRAVPATNSTSQQPPRTSATWPG